jgi:hypothetical protein
MVRPSFSQVFARLWQGRMTFHALPELGIFLGKWHKKVAD